MDLLKMKNNYNPDSGVYRYQTDKSSFFLTPTKSLSFI